MPVKTMTNSSFVKIDLTILFSQFICTFQTIRSDGLLADKHIAGTPHGFDVGRRLGIVT